MLLLLLLSLLLLLLLLSMTILIIGFTCPPTVYLKFITKCDIFIKKCDRYYKVGQNTLLDRLTLHHVILSLIKQEGGTGDTFGLM